MQAVKNAFIAISKLKDENSSLKETNVKLEEEVKRLQAALDNGSALKVNRVESNEIPFKPVGSPVHKKARLVENSKGIYKRLRSHS